MFVDRRVSKTWSERDILEKIVPARLVYIANTHRHNELAREDVSWLATDTAKLAPCNRRLQENNTELTVKMLVGRYFG